MPRTGTKGPEKTPAFAPPRYIAVEGPIRVGKSTLARFLADRMHARRVIDCEDNPVLISGCRNVLIKRCHDCDYSAWQNCSPQAWMMLFRND